MSCIPRVELIYLVYHCCIPPITRIKPKLDAKYHLIHSIALSDDYVLDAADAAGLDIPCSCRGGVCGTCVSKLLSGNIDDSWLTELDDGNVLTAEQMKAGYILPCSAMPRSDLRIEYSYDWGVSILDQWAHTSRA